jgi:hypothetical protein
MTMIDEVIQLLNEAQDILTTNIPDMEVSEWNATPAGRAVSRIHKLVDDE